MRCDQYIGLNRWAKNLVGRKTKVREHGVRIYADGGRKKFSRWRKIPFARKEQAAVISGAYSPVVAHLYRYFLPDGKIYVEYVQAAPWYGGPCYYIALKDENGNPVAESLWTDQEICG